MEAHSRCTMLFCNVLKDIIPPDAVPSLWRKGLDGEINHASSPPCSDRTRMTDSALLAFLAHAHPDRSAKPAHPDGDAEFACIRLVHSFVEYLVYCGEVLSADRLR